MRSIVAVVATGMSMIVPPLVNSAAQADSAVRLACHSRPESTPNSVKLACTLANESDETVLVLLSNATLDGPIGSPAWFDRSSGGGTRHENVMQYGIRTEQGLERGAMFHPWVDLAEDDIPLLRSVSAHASVA